MSQNLENFTKFTLDQLYKQDQKIDEFLKAMKKYEEEFYKSYQKDLYQQLVPELQKKDFKVETVEQHYFLHQKNINDHDYLLSYNQYNRFHNELREGEAPKFLNKQFQQQQDIQFNEFTRPNQNFLDVEANTKHFFPDNKQSFLKNQNKPVQDYGNAQNIYVNYQKPLNIENTEIKNLYPRGLFKPMNNQVDRPSLLKFQDKNLANEIDKLGGIEDTLAGIYFPNNQCIVMEPSLRQYEVEAYKEMISSYKYKDLQMHQNLVMPQNNFKNPIHDINQYNYAINNKNQDPLSVIQIQNGNQQTSPPQQSQTAYEPFSKLPIQRMQYQNIQPRLFGHGTI